MTLAAHNEELAVGSPIILSVNRGISRVDDPDHVYADQAFAHIRPLILKKYENTCCYCGFKAEKWQEVHHVDGNHRNNAEDNLVVACRLCHLCHHLGYVGSRDMGALFICTELSQASLNHLVRTMWIGKRSRDTYIRQQCTAHLENLAGFKEVLEREYGYNSTLQMANDLLQMSDQEYSFRADAQRDIRILFYENGFRDQIQYWASNTYASTPSETWSSLLDTHLPPA